MDIKDIICFMILIVVIVLDVIDMNNLIKKRDNDTNKEKNKSKYIISFALYGLVLFASIYFIIDIVLGYVLN